MDCPDELLNAQSQMDPLVDIMEKEHLDTGKQVVAGICAMAKKSNSKPMREILARLDEFDYIKTIIFPEETILKVNFLSSKNCDVYNVFFPLGTSR